MLYKVSVRLDLGHRPQRIINKIISMKNCGLYYYFFNINLFILIGALLLYNFVLVLPYINLNLPQYVAYIK